MPLLFDRLERIAHPTELGEASEPALAHAVRLAESSSAQLDVLHVGEDASSLDLSEFPNVDVLVQGWDPQVGDLRMQKIPIFGKEPVRPILEHLEERPADLVVLATRRREGIDRLLHREVAGKIARGVPTATLFVPFGVDGFVSPSTGGCSLRRILVPIDWSPKPQVAVEAVALLAEGLGLDDLHMTLMHVGGGELEFPAVDLDSVGEWRWQRKMSEGDVVEEILKAADELSADLLVMPTHGHDGFLDALRGSTTEQVLQRCRCPLLSVPALAG